MTHLLHAASGLGLSSLRKLVRKKSYVAKERR
jgi:hypothetical protein